MIAKAMSNQLTPFPAPSVEPRQGPLGRMAMMQQMSQNMLALYGPEAYRELNLHGAFLDRRSLLTNDPDVIRQVLIEQSGSFKRTDATMRILKPVLGDGLFLAEDAAWKFQRRTMAPAFAPRAMDIVADVSCEVATNSISALSERSNNVDLLEMMQTIALEVAGRSMFSLSMAERGARVRSLFEGYGIKVGRPVPLDMLLPAGVPNLTDWRRQRLGRRWLACVDGLLTEREKKQHSSERPRDLYDLLKTARDPSTNQGFDRHELRDQFATMIIAGHETTALALLWTLLNVARSKPLQKALQHEAWSVDQKTKKGTVADLERLVLHRSVIQESLRLFPPAFLIVREAMRPVRLAGRILFKGDVVSISPWLLHRHERHWDQSTMFDPCRFLPDRKPPNRLTYLPFGAGPRICIGMAFALTEATAVLAEMMRHFSINLEGDQHISTTAVVTTYPDPIPKFSLQRHKQSRIAA